MLKKLYIKDYALIDELTVQFGTGLNILTGETGAGKSIIIGALSMMLGERARSDVVRQGTPKAIVEGCFIVPALDEYSWLWQEIDKNPDGLVLRREINANGRSRCFANDSPISGTLLSTIGDLLIDLHGQHAHQTLLKSEQHINYLDDFGIDDDLLQKMSETYRKYNSLSTELQKLIQEEAVLREKRELLEFQVKEIASINPQEGEEERLEAEEKLLRNSEKLFQTASQLSELLYAGDGSVSEKLSFAEESLRGLQDVDSQIPKWMKACESSRITVEETINSLQAFVAKIDFNPEKLEEMRERLGLFVHIKKKYGGSIEQVIAFRKDSEEKLTHIDSMGDLISEKTESLQKEKENLTRLSINLSDLRTKIAKDLEKNTTHIFEELGLKDGTFRIEIHQKEDENGAVCLNGKNVTVSAKGIDRVEFLISMNPGEDPRPLVKVASGGEISRIMLALKTVLAEADNVPVLVFDEIDTGISGRIARVVGTNLKILSEKHQIICITHLPLIASLGDAQYTVEKVAREGRSKTTIRLLDDGERIAEIAKLIGGEKITDSAFESARELLDVQD